MDWNALLIGLVGGLAGGVLTAFVGIVVVPLQVGADVEREERAARRAWRLSRVSTLMEFLSEVERYHSTTAFRRQLPLMRERIRPLVASIGVTDEQLDAFDVEFAAEKAPLPDWVEVSTKYWGPIIAFEDPEISNHLLMLLMDLCSPKGDLGQGALRPDQRTLLLWRVRFHLERWVSVVPVQRRSILRRLSDALSLRGSWWENVPIFESGSHDKLREEIDSMPPPTPGNG